MCSSPQEFLGSAVGVSCGAHRVKVAAWIGIGMVAALSLSSERFKIEDGSHKLDFVQKYNCELSSFRACLKSTFVGCALRTSL